MNGPATFTLTQGLEITAAVLLVFVTVSVTYLSVVEWRDRRRGR